MSQHGRDIRIALVNGSARPGNYTGKALALVADEFGKHEGIRVDMLNPGLLSLPLPGTDPDHPGAKQFREIISAASAAVLATPEYHGAFSSVIKLAIEHMGFPSALAGKPVALVGVAAGAIGAIKSLEALRAVVSHVGGLALPMSVSVANCQKVFDTDGRVTDPGIEKLVRMVATNVIDYLEQHVCPKYTLERVLREGVTAL